MSTTTKLPGRVRTSIVWFNAKEHRPPKSDRYCVYFVDHQYMTTVSYSKVYDKFNCADHDEDTKHALEPDFWCRLPYQLKVLEETGNDGL